MINVGIITASDQGAKGERIDLSGEVIKEMVAEKGWCVKQYVILPDEREELAKTMSKWADEGSVQLILTTGGTGFSDRDWTPEATTDICERMVPGIPEAMRMASMQITPRVMLSRSVAGIRKHTLIINLPGSPKAVRENLAVIIDTLPHGLEILMGEARECGARS